MSNAALDQMEARLSWRVQGGWERIEAHGDRGLEAVDRKDRRLRIFPGSSGEGYYGTVKYVGRKGHALFQGAITDTWGETPEAAVRRGIERLDERLEEIAERRKELEAPDLSRGVSTDPPDGGDEVDESAGESEDPDAEQGELL